MISCTGFQSVKESSTNLVFLFTSTYNVLHGAAPSYLADMISRVGNGSQRLQSVAHGNLAVPRTWTVRMGKRSLAVSDPTPWNSMPVELKTTHIPLESFKSKLKTYLFILAYDQ